tara:strand:- start:1364 stop:1690 length:327 start_codon:yes stop_codon:yes gene_type:complete
MNQNLSALLESLAQVATVYGTPLYAKLEDKPTFELNKGDFTIVDGDTLVVEQGGLTGYISMRKSAIDAGKTEDDTFVVSHWEAQEDRVGTFQGKEYSIAKGKVKMFAE